MEAARHAHSSLLPLPTQHCSSHPVTLVSAAWQLEMMQGSSARGECKYLDILCERQASVGYLWGRALPHEPIIYAHRGATLCSFL